MFEEDFERCFICQQPCKGLYCSSECRTQDKGTPSPATGATAGPVRLTASIPASLSPLVRPTTYSHGRGQSPRPHYSNSSSSSSDSSSPLQSPSTQPAGFDSPRTHPRKESFNLLPPPAYNLPQSLGFSGSMPVKIPPLAPQASPAPTPQALPTYAGTSVETLRFGRKSGIINSVTSPNALLPRCACGKPAGHRVASRDRTGSISAARERSDLESGLAQLSLVGSVGERRPSITSRIASDSVITSSSMTGGPMPLPVKRSPKATSGHNTPPAPLSGSLLSRSRSDPIPPSPKATRPTPGQVAPLTAQKEPNTIRRASHANPPRPAPALIDTTLPPALHSRSASLVGSPRRGRSRERQRHDLSGDDDVAPGLLNHPPEREHPPSRSQLRGERRRSHEQREAERERERERLVKMDRDLEKVRDRERDATDRIENQILPSWSKRQDGPQSPGGGMVPRRGGGPTSPQSKTPAANVQAQAQEHAWQI